MSKAVDKTDTVPVPVQVPVPVPVPVPITPSADNVLALQPMAQEYLAPARAIATSLAYRYMGLNLGYGAARRSATSPDAALAVHNTPVHHVQVALAEWLYVFAALAHSNHDCGTMTALDPTCKAFSVAGVAVINSPSELLTAPEGVRAGTHFPSLSSVLVYLADWLGAVVPLSQTLSRGDVSAVATPLMDRAVALRVSTMASTCLPAVLYSRGRGFTDALFVQSLGSFFAATPVSVCLVCVPGPSLGIQQCSRVHECLSKRACGN